MKKALESPIKMAILTEGFVRVDDAGSKLDVVPTGVQEIQSPFDGEVLIRVKVELSKANELFYETTRQFVGVPEHLDAVG